MTFRVESEVLAFAQELQDLLDGVLPRPDDIAEQDRQVKVEVVVVWIFSATRIPFRPATGTSMRSGALPPAC